MKKAHGLRLAISMIVIFTLFFPGVSARAQNGPAEVYSGGLRERVELTLRADGAPLPGGTSQLSIDAIPLIDVPDLEIHWYIPEGVQLLGNDADTFSSVTAHQTVNSERTLSFPTTGTYKIIVSASLHLSPDASYGSAGVLFFVIDPHGSYVTDKDPDAHRPVRSGLPVQVTTSSVPSNITLEPDDDPCFTISAHFDRIEREVTRDGYGPDVRIPLAGIGVEFRESDLVFDDSYGTLGTDANGNVIGSFCDDDGILDDELEIYLRLTAERGDPIVYVEDSSYIDEKYEYDTGEVASEGGWIDFNVNLDHDWSAIFNIIDAAWQARYLWVESGGSFSEETEIHWEPGYGDTGSYYDPTYSEITIADGPGDPDQWDESVIMHEWGHFATDHYGCDESPGGDHSHDEIIGSEFAFDEGFSTYYQLAVRDYLDYPDASWYLDINSSGVQGITYNLNDFHVYHPSLVSIGNEGAVAAAFWDLNDTDDGWDYQDRVGYGHAAIQNVYTSDAFLDIAYGLFDDTCDFDTYMRGWVDSGMPADQSTAAVVKENTGYTLLPAKQISESLAGNWVEGDYSPADIYRWWKQLAYVADNSASMNGPKFNAMQTLFVEAVNDLGDDPEGTEFSLELFNNTITSNETAFAGQFFPETLIDPINALSTIPDADPNCEVNALRALAQAVDDKEKGDVWLFTDGDTDQNPSVDSLRQLLNENKMRASMALMGLCPPKGENSILKGAIFTETLEGLTPEEQQTMMGERLLAGQAREQLGLMAEDIPGGIVPYLLTALNSGGQFLYVDSSQVADAADILRAQITNSAGAGRWSDYVSDQPTYRWDKLASWEYNWIDARYGTSWGNPQYNHKLDIPIPGYFQYFSGPYYDTVHVFEDGYLTLGLHEAYVYNNTTLPNPAEPNSALYPFWDNIKPYCPIPAEGSPEVCDGWIYSLQQGDWFAIEYFQYQYNYPDPLVLNTFEILLNLETYEIRYQYQTVPNGAESATIGLENSNGTIGLQLSYNDVNGASDGMGYKLTPAPPQPTKTYIVTVDSTMESIGFLLTGYSGSFEPLEVSDPNGNPVNCSDPGTMCLDLDLVQYVQVNTNGRVGDWEALVDAGNTGSGTFSFTSFAVSPIYVEGSINHTLSTGTQQLLVQVAGQVDGCVLSGLFHKADGSPFGYSINFFDDGLHNDKDACDGLYGSGSFFLGAGSAYLTLQGLHNGEAFLRIDPNPYTFQPFQMQSMGDGVNYGGVTELQFQLTNKDIHNHCYWISYSAPEGWWIEFPFLPMVCVDAGQTEVDTFDVYLTSGFSNNLPSGTTGIMTISATEWEKGAISDSASARITRHRQPARIDIFNPTHFLRPNGDTASLEFLVTDLQGVAVADGTEIQLVTNNGSLSPNPATTEHGSFMATFTSGENIGTAAITAMAPNGIYASTEIEIGNPLPDRITLWISNNQLPADGVSTTTLVATVCDEWGNPVPNQMVKIGTEGDGLHGTIVGGYEGQVISGYTDTDGEFSVIFTSGNVAGVAGIRAELLILDGVNTIVVDHDRKVIYVGINLIHLPLVRR